MNKRYLKWEEINQNWNNINRNNILLNWEDIAIIEEVNSLIRGGGQGLEDYIKGNPWKQMSKSIGDENAKKFIRLFCDINGLEFEMVKEYKKNNIKIEASHFEKVFDESKKVKISFKK